MLLPVMIVVVVVVVVVATAAAVVSRDGDGWGAYCGYHQWMID
jgi:hypothetical protein